MLLNKLSILFLFLFLGTFSASLFSQKDNLAHQFFIQEENLEGVILLYDFNNDRLFTSNTKKSTDRFLPASTFKIFNTLLFLELGIASDTSYTLQWDGSEHKHKGKTVNAWNKDTNLAQAFRNSTVWYYEKLSKLVDFSLYKEYLQDNKYGRVYRKSSSKADFWNYGAKIGMSAKDQIKFLVKIYEGKTNFKSEHVEIVKELMIEEHTNEYILRSKTGWTETPEKKFHESVDLGWYIGYIEYVDNTYFFAIRLEKPLDGDNAKFSKARKSIAKKALRHQFNLNLN